MWPRAGLPMLSTKKARSRASKPAVCGQSARPVLSEYAARPQRCAPPSEWTEWTPRGPTRRAAAYKHAAVGDAPRFGFAHRKPDQRAAAQMDASHLGLARLGPARFAAARMEAPQPGLTRRSRTRAPRPGAARRDSDCRAAARLDVPQFEWMRRSADKKPAAFPLSPCRTFVLRRPARRCLSTLRTVSVAM